MKVRIPNQNGGMSQQQMLKKVQQMQEDMAVLQEDLDNREYTASAGGDMVP
jgi:DNA-binding protein YbaB